MRYTSKYFMPFELLPPSLYAKYGSAALTVMDDRILYTLDELRDYFRKPITVNNWHEGGPFQQRGFRDDPDTGAALSQHRFGRAADFDVKGVTANEVRDLMRKHSLDEQLEHITRCEDGVSWVHIDCANTDGDGIVFFNK